MLKKMLSLCVGGALLATPAAAQDMSLEEVLNNYYEAIGGLDAWKSVEAMRATGTMSMPAQGIEAAFDMTAKRPKKVRLEFTLQGMTGVQAYDGETAWMSMPFMGNPEPEEMPEDQAKELKEEADIDGPLVGYEEEGHQVELVGLEETEGTSAYKLKVTRASGDVQYYFLDAEYFVPIKIEGTRTQMGQEIEYESILSDYKEIGGLLMPHSIENKPKGAASAAQIITIDQVEINPMVDDSKFRMPEKTEGGADQG